MNDAQLKAVRLSALRYLTARALTSRELSKKLAGKGFATEDIDVVIAEFTKKRLLDDAGITDDVIESSSQYRLEGRRQIRNRLIKRGVDAIDVEQKLKTNYSIENEYNAGVEFAKKKLRSLANYPAYIQRRRIGSALDRRGFSPELTHKILSEINFSTTDNGNVEEI